jgi:flagellar hook-associated protein 2
MATTGIDSSSLSLSGLASGFDWKSFVSQMVAAERSPETRLRSQQTTLQQRNTSLGRIKDQLTSLRTLAQALEATSLYATRAVQLSDATAGSAKAADGATTGTYIFNVSQLATAATMAGSANIASSLTTDPSATAISDAGFPAPVTAGNFTVNGQQVSIATTDTVQAVLDKIAAATQNLPAEQQVTATYDATGDVIRLSSAGEIILGTATDTSNFLQAARLFNNGTGSVASTVPLGSVRTTGVALSQANLTTAITDGGSGSGEFQINGVSIAFNAGTDSVSDVLKRINQSTAGVTASYDTINDRFILTSRTQGDMGIALQDVTGNFLAATGLTGAGSQFTHGKNLIYTVNGGDPITSQTSAITEASSGIAGLTLTMLKENTPLTVSVSSDTTKIKAAIQAFIDSYNQVQSYIDAQTASSTDAQGKVTAGILASDGTADSISSDLRRTVFSTLSEFSGTISRLADLGYQTNGYNNKIALSDSSQLDEALSENLIGVQRLFSDSENGLAIRIDKFLGKVVDDSGTLVQHQTDLTKQSARIDAQIASMEKLILADQTRMTNSFVAMETAQAKLTQQLSYLTKNFS